MTLELHDVSAWTPITAKLYRGSLRRFRAWCERTGRDTAFLTDRDLAAWVSTQSPSPSATRITLAAVGAAYASLDRPSPAGDQTHFAIRRQVKNAPPGRVKHAITVPELRKLVQLAPPTIACAAVVCWHGALRISELESLSLLHLTEKVAIVTVLGKAGRRQVRLVAAEALDLCPLYWLRNHAPSSWAGIRKPLIHWAKAAGLPSATHAFRRGWSTEAARQGISAVTISLFLGHTDARAALAYVGAAALQEIGSLC